MGVVADIGIGAGENLRLRVQDLQEFVRGTTARNLNYNHVLECFDELGFVDDTDGQPVCCVSTNSGDMAKLLQAGGVETFASLKARSDERAQSFLRVRCHIERALDCCQGIKPNGPQYKFLSVAHCDSELFGARNSGSRNVHLHLA